MSLLPPVRIGLCGLGTVGQATLAVLARNGSEISRRAGRTIEVTRVANRSPRPDLPVTVEADALAVATAPDVDVVVELIGGTDAALELVLAAIRAGKHVVTANKALVAEHGNTIFAAAQQQGVMVAFEASVAGGIPIIKAIREGLAANRINWVAGIINGTSNYILTAMEQQGQDFASALADAQALGYAEADPTFDIDGTDAGHKLTILASIAFGIPLNFAAAYLEGIDRVSAEDITYAAELGYRIKHLGITRRATDSNGKAGVELRVHPVLVPRQRLIANVDGVLNAVLVDSDTVGPTLYHGPGAGGDATASAVVADLVDVVRTLTTDSANRVPHLAFQPDQLDDTPVLPIGEVETGYYLRIPALDQPGVLARITQALATEGISIEAMIQKDAAVDQAGDQRWVPVIILTHPGRERNLQAALDIIQAMPEVAGTVVRLRVESLAGQP